MVQQADNLIPYIDGFKKSELTYISYALNTFGGVGTIHAGSLPFVSKKLAQQCLFECGMKFDIREPEHKMIKRLLDKLEFVFTDKQAKFQMFLITNKVLRVAGFRNNENIVRLRLPFFTEVEAGIKWQQFGKKYLPVKLNLPRYIELQCLRRRFSGRDLWEITCAKGVEEKTKDWICERFAT